MIISKVELRQIIKWFYKELYAANLFDNQDEDQQYQCYLEGLLERVTETLPDSVRLLRLQQIYREPISAAATEPAETEPDSSRLLHHSETGEQPATSGWGLPELTKKR
jgi:hypothetical protein